MNGDDKPTGLWVYVIAYLVMAVLLIVIWSCMGVHHVRDFVYSEEDKDRIAQAGQYGDSFAYVNSLFSALTLAGVILALVMQTRELRLQQTEMIESRQAQQQIARFQYYGSLLTALNGILEGAVVELSSGGELDVRKLQARDRLDAARNEIIRLTGYMEVLESTLPGSDDPSHTANLAASEQNATRLRRIEWLNGVRFTRNEIHAAVPAFRRYGANFDAISAFLHQVVKNMRQLEHQAYHDDLLGDEFSKFKDTDAGKAVAGDLKKTEEELCDLLQGIEVFLAGVIDHLFPQLSNAAPTQPREGQTHV